MDTASKIGKRIASTVVAGCLSVACMGLVACGGTANTTGSAASAGVSADSGSVSTASKFAGKWKMAGAQMNGFTLAGNFGQMIGISDNLGLEVKEDGTGSITVGGEATSFTWTEAGSDTINITVKNESSSSATTVPESTSITAKDGALFMTIKQEDQEGSIIFTADGTYASAKDINPEEAKAITSESDLIGTWNLVGLDVAGISMYGEGDTLQSQLGQAGGAASTSLTFEKGGTVKTGSESGASATWAVDANGATFTVDGLDSKVNLPIKKLGDQLVIDLSSFTGNVEAVLVYGK